MNNQIFTSLVSPAIALTLAMPFAGLWLYRRDRVYLLVIALAYCGAAAGFLMQAFTLPIGFEETKFLSNITFILAALALATAILTRYGSAIPWAVLTPLVVGGLGGFFWFMFVQPDLTWRMMATNFALAGISLTVAAKMKPLAGKGPIERTMLALVLLSGLNFFFRPIVLVAISDLPLDYSNLYTSLYWTTSLFSHAVFSLLIALSLMAAEALDVIKALRSETYTDPLSGLLNRRGFDIKASIMLDACRSATNPVSLIVADLDRFKTLNDRHGHAAGDRVIAQFASHLQKAAGPQAVVARLGGEEFAVLVPMAGPATARLFAEGVRTSISAAPMDGLPEGFRVTASFGVASRLADESLAELARRADEALYLAKRDGRDKVRVYRRFASSNRPPPPRAGHTGRDPRDYRLNGSRA